MNPQYGSPPFSQTDDSGLGSSLPGSTVEPAGQQNPTANPVNSNQATNDTGLDDNNAASIMQSGEFNRVSPNGSKDDNDDLEEEWINKAKTIVEHTRADPYEQSNQLSRMKATYLKTHYNKDIKLSEDEAR